MNREPTLVLYSGGQNPSNQLLHRELVNQARVSRQKRQKNDHPLRLTYLPFCADGSVTYFMRSVRRYSRFGVGEFCCLTADERPSRLQIKTALQADIVYLAGGNTFYFLKALRKSGLFSFLQEYAASGGILAGLSAGAHILTPHIKLAGVPGLDPDDNDVKLRDLSGLGLAPFEILPHFRGGKRYLSALQAYSLKSRYPIFACPDGSGVIVRDNVAKLIGQGIKLYSGGVEIGPT